MSQITLDGVLDVVEQLELEDQEKLIQVISRKLADRERQRLVESVRQAEIEFAAGECRVMSPKEIIREALDG